MFADVVECLPKPQGSLRHILQLDFEDCIPELQLRRTREELGALDPVMLVGLLRSRTKMHLF